MDEKYRLVFRGEVLDGQHRAVVKRRLVESLNLSETQAEKLFSGDAVVLKKSVEPKVAARYQALFKQAGGRLRVYPAAPARATAAEPVGSVDTNDSAEQPAPPTPESPAATPAADTASSLTLLSQEEVDKAAAAMRSGPITIQAPEFSLAELGTDIAEPESVEPPVVPEVDFSLAEPGVDLISEKPQVEVVEVKELEVDIADVGAMLVEPSSEPVPDAPDISHIELAEPA